MCSLSYNGKEIIKSLQGFSYGCFTGSVSPSGPCNLINTTSVLLYPSFIGVPYYEGSGCPYLQALGTGPSRNFYSYVSIIF